MSESREAVTSRLPDGAHLFHSGKLAEHLTVEADYYHVPVEGQEFYDIYRVRTSEPEGMTERWTSQGWINV